MCAIVSSRILASSFLSIQFTLLLPVWCDTFPPFRYKADVMFRAFLHTRFMSLLSPLKHSCLFNVFLVLYLDLRVDRQH